MWVILVSVIHLCLSRAGVDDPRQQVVNRLLKYNTVPKDRAREETRCIAHPNFSSISVSSGRNLENLDKAFVAQNNDIAGDLPAIRGPQQLCRIQDKHNRLQIGFHVAGLGK